MTTVPGQERARLAATLYLLAAGLLAPLIAALTAGSVVLWGVLAAAPVTLWRRMRRYGTGRAGTTNLWLAPALAAGGLVAALERRALRAVLDVPDAAVGGRAFRARAITVTLLLALPGLGAALGLTVLAIAAAIVGTLPLWADASEQLAFGSLGVLPVGTVPRQWVGSLLGVGLAAVVVVAAPWLGEVRARLVARALGAPSADDTIAALHQELDHVHAGRIAAVRLNVADQIRIERDLHDGVQGRLTALVMNLGRAKRKVATDPETAARLIEDAHAYANQALDEIRSIARGIRPPVLTESGLAAALTSRTATFPIPVDIRVDLEERPAPVIEMAMYYMIAESLTNVIKHARAKRAWVHVRRDGDRCTVEVGDDGIGGANATDSGGLRGLSDRALAVGGAVTMRSPAGGPTTIHIVLPCG